MDTARSADEIEASLRSDPVWGAELSEAADAAGRDYFVWGDDPYAIAPERSAGPRPLGRGGAMAVTDGGTAIRSVNPQVVEEALAAIAGDAPSLGGDDSYVAVARALDDAGVYSALFTSENFGVDPAALLLAPGSDPAEIEERLESITTVPPYLAIGIGNKVDLDADPQGVLVLAFAATTPEAAKETIAAMEEIVAGGESIVTDVPWSELLTITSTSTDGSVALIELRTANPQIGVRSFVQRDTLFVSS